MERPVALDAEHAPQFGQTLESLSGMLEAMRDNPHIGFLSPASTNATLEDVRAVMENLKALESGSGR